MSGTFFLFFLINHIMDTGILFLVRQKMFPDKNVLRIIAGGGISSAAYLLWSCVHMTHTNWVLTGLAVLLVLFLLKIIFQIKTLSLLMRTLRSALMYAFILGGISIQIKRILPAQCSLKTLTAVSLTLLMCISAHPLLIKKEQRSRKREENLYCVEIKRGNCTVKCMGLYDSGNLLTSQLTGEGICVIDGKEGNKLLSKKEKNYDLTAGICNDGRIYPIQYHSVGQSNGYMPGVLADHIIISRNKEILADKKGMVGICKGEISKDERFSVLLPEDIFS